MRTLEHEIQTLETSSSRVDRNLQLKASSLEAAKEDLLLKSKIHKELELKRQNLAKEIGELSQMPHTQLENSLPNPERVFVAIGQVEKKKEGVRDREKGIEIQREKRVLELMACRRKEKVVNQKITLNKKEFLEREVELEGVNGQEKDLTLRLIGLKEEMEKDEERVARRDVIQEEQEEIRQKLKELEGVEQEEFRVRAAQKDMSREAPSFRGELSRLVAVLNNKYR